MELYFQLFAICILPFGAWSTILMYHHSYDFLATCVTTKFRNKTETSNWYSSAAAPSVSTVDIWSSGLRRPPMVAQLMS